MLAADGDRRLASSWKGGVAARGAHIGGFVVDVELIPRQVFFGNPERALGSRQTGRASPLWPRSRVSSTFG